MKLSGGDIQDPAIKTERLCKRYVSGKVKVQVLEDLDLEVRRGSCLLLRGPSGSGKTTLLNVIGTLTKPTSGRVLISGKDISHLPEHFLVQLRRQKIGFVFQQYNLLHSYTCLENIGMSLMPLGISAKERREKGLSILRELNLEDRADFKVNELSGGEQQRVSIARALVNDPNILLADEPTSNIDLKNAEAILEILAKLKSEQKTLVVVSHDPLIVESSLPDDVLDMTRTECL